MPKPFRRILPTGLALMILLPATAAQSEGVCTMQGNELEKRWRDTVVITDPDVFTNKAFDFSLGRTLGNILSTGGVADSKAERIALLASMIRTFNNLDRENGGVSMPATPRPGEAGLDPLELLDGPETAKRMHPVGLFNRFDAAPRNWAYCGEHRIVYALGNQVVRAPRFLLIFEAALKNPDPQNRREGCEPVAEFWNGIGEKTVAQQTEALWKFYYEGLAPLPPVLHALHFGLPFGQVRANMFVTAGEPWMLREWRISATPDKALVFTPDTVKANPHPALFDSKSSGTEPDSQAFADLRPLFQDKFVTSHIRELLNTDLAAAAAGKQLDPSTLFSNLGARFDGGFNAFESIARDEHDPVVRAQSTDLPALIAAELANFNPAAVQGLTAQHMLNRAGALSCGGCHRFTTATDGSSNEVAPGVPWPDSLGFVHIDETGDLSDALEQHFLPDRCRNMNEFRTQEAPAVELGAPGEEVQVEESLAAVRQAEGPAQTIEALIGLEATVQEARQQNQQRPGALVRFRRPH